MPTKRTRRRDFISFRLSEDDSDLADWWEDLPEGQGATEIKAAIRKHIDSPSDNNPVSESYLDDRLTTVIQKQQEQIAELNKTIQGLAGQLTALTNKIASGITVNTSSAAPTADVPQLSQEEQAARIKKIVSRDW